MKGLIGLLILSMFAISCGSSNSPTSSNNNPTNYNPYSSLLPPTGNYVLGVLAGSVINSGSGPTTSFSSALVEIACNQQPVTGATVVLTAPSGPVTLPFSYGITFTYNGTNYGFADYDIYSPAMAYTPGSTYTLSVIDPLGSVSASMPAPGGVAWSGAITTTLKATAAYPGNYDSAIVEEASPNPGLIYTSLTTSVGNPFSYPTTAFSVASSPATFDVTYSAATTQFAFSGSVASGSAFVWDQTTTNMFNK